MNRLFFILLSTFTVLIQPIAKASKHFVATNHSICNDNIIGTWTLKYESTSLDQDKTSVPMLMIQTFNQDGSTNLRIEPFLDSNDIYSCTNDTLTIIKIVPSNLNLIRLSATEMVYKEEGGDKYFYFAK